LKGRHVFKGRDRPAAERILTVMLTSIVDYLMTIIAETPGMNKYAWREHHGALSFA